jgi:hypothetical protein
LVKEGFELVAEGAVRRFLAGAIGGLLSQTGGDFQGPAGVSKTHPVEVVPVQVFEIALGGVEDGLGQEKLAVAEYFGAGGRIEEFLAAHGVFGFEVALGALGGASLDPTAPIEVAGPAFDGAQGGADLSAHGRKTAAGAQLPVSTKGFEGAVGFVLEWLKDLRRQFRV